MILDSLLNAHQCASIAYLIACEHNTGIIIPEDGRNPNASRDIISYIVVCWQIHSILYFHRSCEGSGCSNTGTAGEPALPTECSTIETFRYSGSTNFSSPFGCLQLSVFPNFLLKTILARTVDHQRKTLSHQILR